MGIINISKLVELMGANDHYSYKRVKNMLSGLKGRSSVKEIQRVRKIIRQQLTEIDNTLERLEKQ